MSMLSVNTVPAAPSTIATRIWRRDVTGPVCGSGSRATLPASAAAGTGWGVRSGFGDDCGAIDFGSSVAGDRFDASLAGARLDRPLSGARLDPSLSGARLVSLVGYSALGTGRTVFRGRTVVRASSSPSYLLAVFDRAMCSSAPGYFWIRACWLLGFGSPLDWASLAEARSNRRAALRRDARRTTSRTFAIFRMASRGFSTSHARGRRP
jgi:hypothetical protein